MNRSVLRSVLLYALLAGGFVLSDVVIDHLVGDPSELTWPHFLLAAVAVLVSYLLLNRAMETRKGAEAVLRQARDELEIRVRERTTELERTNQALQAEMAERRRAEQARERMERALRESEEKYRTQFDNFSEPTTVWDRNGVLLMQNLVSARNLGGSREDYVGKTISDIFGDAAATYMARMVRVIDTGITENQEDIVELPSGKHYFSTCMQRVKNPDGQYAVQIMSYDITHQRRTQEALRASEDKFATVFRLSPDAITIVRMADGTLLDINEAFTRLLGYSRSEVIGKPWAELNLAPATDERDKVAELFQESGRLANYELSLTTRAGDLATMIMSLVSITVNGELCLLVIAHDITKRKRSEDALRRAQAELAQGVQERAALEERQRLARELHDSVSQALYGISLGAHTALTLLDTDRTRVLEALDYVISLAEAGLAEMRALIFELRPESLEMEGLVSALTKQTAALRARYGIEVEVSLCDEPAVPFSVKHALYRISQEALQNAVKHARSNRLDVRLTYVPDSLGLEVCDDGVGFDPLAAYPGHLGLHSMRERVASVGGTLEIASQPNHGTQIRARVPIPYPAS